VQDPQNDQQIDVHWHNTPNDETGFELIRINDNGTDTFSTELGADVTSFTDQIIPYDKYGNAVLTYYIMAQKGSAISTPTSVGVLAEEVTVTSITVHVLHGIQNKYNGFDFTDYVEVHGTHLEQTAITQTIFAKTSYTNILGDAIPDSEVQRMSPGDPNVLNTAGGTPVTDTDWDWQPYDTISEGTVGHHGDEQRSLDIYATPQWNAYGTIVNAADLFTIERNFNIKVSLQSDHTHILGSHSWGYNWSNWACILKAGQEEQAAESRNNGKGVFSNIQGIDGLDSLN
jgi:hypothetical protein